jgi:antitoxin ParD1/3/4
MTVSLNPDVQKFVEQKVKAGRYASAEEAVNSLLSMVKEQEQCTPRTIEELRAEIDRGIADIENGRFVEFTAESVIAERRAAMAKRKQS